MKKHRSIQAAFISAVRNNRRNNAMMILRAYARLHVLLEEKKGV